jgi:uncharacterized protein (TIGR02271 family)
MSRTVTALYDTKAEAEAARQRLSSAVNVEHVKVIDHAASQSGGLDRYGMSHEDRHAYGEGLRRGGALLCAEVDGDEDTNKIVRVLEETSGVDLEERQRSWQSDGWSPYSGAGAQTEQAAADRTAPSGSSPGAVQEERIPLVKEELRVGKREVERGGVRVRTYVCETPVREQVTLREEHVSVERRPVAQDGTATTGTVTGDMLQERTIEMTETAEQAVVQKVANVTEEVVLTKTAQERTEQVEDTVRETKVEVDDGTRGASGENRSAFGGFGGGSGQGGDR